MIPRLVVGDQPVDFGPLLGLPRAPLKNLVPLPAVVDPDGRIEGSLRRDVAGRLWTGAEVDERGCWLWVGADRGVGYGAIKVGAKVYDTHRLAYLLARGPIVGRLCVMHACDVRRCINPAHLSVGTHLDNHRDMVRKGRRVTREQASRVHKERRDAGAIPGMKLDHEKVERIRAIWREGGHTHASIGVMFGVCRSTIGKILAGEKWAPVAAESRGAA